MRPVRPDRAGIRLPSSDRIEGRSDGVEIVRARYASDHRHGRCVLGDALAAVASRPGGVDITRAVWLDIETTGLAGGTGTYAFLVGVAYLDGPALVTEQLLLRRLSGEHHLLALLRERLDGIRHLVTFNGRRFDWPILEARFILARWRAAPIEDHTDLIHPARWLWHRVLGTHRLSTLEAEVLGAPRPHDIPGWMIPSIYIEYLRGGDRASLDPVLAHNRADLLAMVVLHGEVTRILADPHAVEGPIDWEGLGVLLARQGDGPQAAACFERAATQAHEPKDRWRILRRLVRQYRRLGDVSRARARWEEEAVAWVRPDIFRIHVLEEVAKARGARRDFAGARRATEEALELTLVQNRHVPGPAPDLSPLAERLRRRLARLADRDR
jgi:uncharacterized protein YprB with RNaseH-like and TPR domain